MRTTDMAMCVDASAMGTRRLSTFFGSIAPK
jgi:hypothetical protein